jgi:hypothetical protein
MNRKEYIFAFLIALVFILLIGKYYFYEEVYSPNSFVVNNLKEDLIYAKYDLKYSDLEVHNYSNSSTQLIPVLVYHGIWNEPYKNDVTIYNFEDQMRTLKENGYETITLEEFENFVNGKIELPEKSFMITFDDGVKSSYYNTDPILTSLDYNAIMFIITKYSLDEGSSYYLSLEEIREMLGTGRWDIEALFLAFISIGKKIRLF